MCSYHLSCFLASLHLFLYAHTKWPLTLALISLALFLLFVQFCLNILVTWAALSSWKRHLKGWCGDELTEGLAHRAWLFPLPFITALSTLRHYIWAAAERKEEKAVTRADPTHALSFHSSVNVNCHKETPFFKHNHVILYESFPKPNVHMDDIPCHNALHCAFPLETSQAIQVQSKYQW